MVTHRDAVSATPGARLPPILQGRPDPRLRRNMEAYAATHDVRGLMGELTQSIMVRMPEDPRRFLAEELGRQLQQQADDHAELGAMPRGSCVLSLHASAGHGREGAGRALRWQRVLSSAPSGRIARYQAERELTEQLRAVIWGGGAGGGEHHELHAEPQAESEQDIGDFKMKLRLRIAADPEAFFALADTTHDDSLSPEEWLEACRSSLGNADETECRALFDEMV